MRRTMAVLAALMLAAGHAWALDLAGYTIGREFTQADRDALVRHGAGNGGCEGSTCSGAVYLGDIDGHATVTLDSSGRIASVAVDFPAADFSEMVSAAKSKFGKPSVVLPGRAQNGFGATFQDASLTWQRRDGTVMLMQRIGRIDTSMIVASAPGFKAAQPNVKL